MDTTNGSNLPKKPGRPKGLPKTGGRVKGKLPPMGKNFREVLRNLIAIDDESVVRLKQINGSAVAARERLWQTLHGLRPATTQEFLAVMKFCADYGVGTPVKMQGDVVQRDPLLFVTRHGFTPWDPQNPNNKEMNARSEQMIQAKAEQLALEAASKQAEVVSEADATKGDTDAEGLEAVVPPPAEDPSAYR